MCMKRVVNHEDRRGGKEQQAPLGLQYLSQHRCGDVCEVNHWRTIIITHLDWESGSERCFSPKVTSFSVSELNSTETVGSVWGRGDVPSQKECSGKCLPSALGICILLSQRVPPHPNVAITTYHLAACQNIRRSVHKCTILYLHLWCLSLSVVLPGVGVCVFL